jgi:hypothetical protein
MKANKSKDDKSRGDEPETREEVFRQAFEKMCLALDKFGPGEVLRILTENSHHDIICRDLLLRFPTVVSSAEFFHSLKVIKTNKQTFNRLKKRGWIL